MQSLVAQFTSSTLSVRCAFLEEAVKPSRCASNHHETRVGVQALLARLSKSTYFIYDIRRAYSVRSLPLAAPAESGFF